MMGQKEIWDDLVGDAWVRHAEVIDAHSAPFGRAAMDLLGPLHGRTVLDVGCGTGSTTLELARRGASEVIGVDLSERMIGHARAQRAGAQEASVGFQVVDALSVEDLGRFDAIFSRFGVMFFDDATDAFAHLRRLVAPSGRLGFCSWQGPLANPWMSLAILASVPLFGLPAMAGPDQPGPFSLAEPERVHEVLQQAGWRDVQVEDLTVEAAHPAGDRDSVAAVLVENVPPLAEGLVRSPHLRGDLLASVSDALRPYERDGGVYLGAAALVVGASG